MSTKNILVIDSSTRKDESVSRKISFAIIQELKAKYNSLDIMFEDLSENPPPYLSLEQISAFFTPDGYLQDEQREALQHSDKYIGQLFKAEIIIISYPVINFCIPSSLKSWIDQVVRVHKTFHYKDSLPHGLLKNKKCYFAVARGGIYTDNFAEQKDHFPDLSIAYMKTVLSYIGLTDISIFKADGLAIPEVKESSLEKTLFLIKEEIF